jgi:hypothetical protein
MTVSRPPQIDKKTEAFISQGGSTAKLAQGSKTEAIINLRVWERVNGKTHLRVEAGAAMHPTEDRFVELGLPFGPKSRMLLMHINQRAIIAQSPEIEVEDSLTQFVSRVLKLDTKGRNIRADRTHANFSSLLYT